MAAAESSTRVDDAYEWLLAEITGFRLRSGSPLSENRLAQQLGISRTPVREALQRLEKEGLVKRTDNARFTVSQLTATEVNDACDLLELLDTYICRKAASTLTDADAAVLKGYVDDMYAAAGRDDRAAWALADQLFHRSANALAGNVLVAETVRETRRRIQRFWLRAASLQSRLRSCAEEYDELYRAMVANDAAAIEPAVKKHIGHMRERMLEMIAAAAILLGDD
ncbi:GntR family transcriptional regulator [Herbiconiux moechotypicola]|uniref:GntR family transcriptional regulator n=1 Tax=Herbiconiux moechotypicola TaxID=637393 RepID=A0ABN3DBL1_9MICO|nr:GntR family transcriptional regulator [Herbiconiux moechotypicola]MCS5728828.1 GntR family transcriptional regulator [Herbiconiux moechotypicola]